MAGWIKDTNRTVTTVEGLVPFLRYTFYVTAENAVSTQDSDAASRTAEASVITKEGGISRLNEIGLERITLNSST